MPLTPETERVIKEYAIVRAVCDEALALGRPELAKDVEAFRRELPERYEYMLGFHGFSRSRWHSDIASIAMVFKGWGERGRAKWFWHRCLRSYYLRLGMAPRRDTLTAEEEEQKAQWARYGITYEPFPPVETRPEYVVAIAWQIGEMNRFFTNTEPGYIEDRRKIVLPEDMVSPGWVGS